MANPFYSSDEQRAARVDDLFARIAPRYDAMNDLQSFGLHRIWKRRLVNLAGVRSGEHALDVCCGTGDISLALAARGARVIGLDFNRAMLAVAEARRGKAGPRQNAGRIQFVRGDALQLPFADESFEIVTMAYGLRNLASTEAGLREMQRVLRPGGRVLVLDFGKPDNACWRAVYQGYMKVVVPLLGRLVCGTASAYAYILESLKHYPAQKGVAGQMRALGLARIGVINFLGGTMSIHHAEKAGIGATATESVAKPEKVRPI